MPPTLSPQAARERFLAEQKISFSPGRLAVECAVCGSDFGGTSWTTVDEAKRVAEMLGVGPGNKLLEIGAGSGWPGVFLGRETGCDLVLSDIPDLGLGAALARGREEGLSGLCMAAAAGGEALPFLDGAFDAVSHSDVLCCLPGKFETLRDSRRVTKAGGRTVFSVISIPPGLPGADYERASHAAPPFAESEAPYPEMIERAGWEIAEHIDMTGQYLDSARITVTAEEENGAALRELHGDEDYEARLERRKMLVGVLEDGLACREIFSAVAIS